MNKVEEIVGSQRSGAELSEILLNSADKLDALFGNENPSDFFDLIYHLYENIKNSKQSEEEIFYRLAMFPFSFKESILTSLLTRLANKRILNGYYKDKIIVLPTLEKSSSTFHELMIWKMLVSNKNIFGYIPIVRSMSPGGPLSLAGRENLNPGMLLYLINGGILRGCFEPSFANEHFIHQIKAKSLILLRHPADRLVAQLCQYYWLIKKNMQSNNEDLSDEEIMQRMLAGKYPKLPGIKENIEWIGGWVEKSRRNNFAFIKYENMLVNLDAHVSKIYDYLYDEKITKEMLKEIKDLFLTTKQGGKNQPGVVEQRVYKNGYSGKIGIWRNYFTTSHIKFYNKEVEKYLAYTNCPDEILKIYPDLLLSNSKIKTSSESDENSQLFKFYSPSFSDFDRDTKELFG